MSEFLKILEEHYTGIIVILLGFLSIFILIHYGLWILGRGRFNRENDPVRLARPPRERLNFVLADAAIKIINDFRHFLALLIVLVFSLVLGYAVIGGAMNGEKLQDNLQAVMATLGGLVGSIIGYYFGESAVRQNTTVVAPNTTPTTNPVVNPVINDLNSPVAPIQDANITAEEIEAIDGIEAAPKPPTNDN